MIRGKPVRTTIGNIPPVEAKGQYYAVADNIDMAA